MKTKPVENFIPRSLDPKVQTMLNTYSELVEEIVNYGSNIISWRKNDYLKGEESLPITLFLRNFLSYMDACSILIKDSSIEPCQSLLRTAFENLLYILYLLDDDSGKKSLSFIVWNAFERSKIINKHDGESPSYKKLEEAFKNDMVLNEMKPPILQNIEKRRASNTKVIQLGKYKEIVDEYNRTLKNKKGNQIFWYSLFNGPGNIKNLSVRLKMEGFYEILYKNWSSSVHGTAIIDGNISNDDKGILQIDQIRKPNDPMGVTGYCINLSVMLFTKFIKAKIPDKYSDFVKWYKDFIPSSNKVLYGKDFNLNKS